MPNRLTPSFANLSTVRNTRVEDKHIIRNEHSIPNARMNVRMRREAMPLDRMRVDKMYARSLKKGGRL